MGLLVSHAQTRTVSAPPSGPMAVLLRPLPPRNPFTALAEAAYQAPRPRRRVVSRRAKRRLRSTPSDEVAGRAGLVLTRSRLEARSRTLNLFPPRASRGGKRVAPWGLSFFLLFPFFHPSARKALEQFKDARSTHQEGRARQRFGLGSGPRRLSPGPGVPRNWAAA